MTLTAPSSPPEMPASSASAQLLGGTHPAATAEAQAHAPSNPENSRAGGEITTDALRVMPLADASACATSGSLVDELRRRVWAGRVIGVLWLAGAAAMPLFFDNTHRHIGWVLAVAAATALIGLLLLVVRLDRLPTWSLDFLLASTTMVAQAAAFALPDQRETLALCSLWAVPFAVAILPPLRAIFQAALVVVLETLITLDSINLATSAWQRATAIGQWILVTITVVAIATVVRWLRQFLHRRSVISEAVAELGTRALGVEDPDALLQEALRVATDVVGSDYGTALRKLSDGQILVVAESGPEPIPSGTILALAERGSYVSYVVSTVQPFVSSDLRRETRINPPESLLSRGVLSSVCVPVVGANKVLGLLALHDHRRHRFGRHEVSAVTALANVVAIAWERSQHRQAQQRLAVYEDRERIALDLHDFVIQRLFAAGLSLQSLRRHVPEGPPIDRLEGIERDLDAAIVDIRSTIFSLQNAPSPDGLPAQIRATVTKAARSLPFTPKVMLRGDVESVGTAAIAKDVLAVIGEALSNIARHAKATSATVKVSVSVEEVRVVVSDNGCGMGTETSRRSGLDNLRLRAQRQGGGFTIRSVPGAGTSVVWMVPLELVEMEGSGDGVDVDEAVAASQL